MKTKNKKAAMEMSVGTIVTIVLLMSVLILGIFLIQRIFDSAKGAIDLTDQELKNEINKLFSSNDNKRIIVFPQSRKLEIKKGEQDEFAFIINNINKEQETFSYVVRVADIASNCVMKEEDAEKIIILGSSKDEIDIGSGDTLETPIRVRLEVPESASLCDIRFSIDVDSSSGSYTSSDVDVTIK